MADELYAEPEDVFRAIAGFRVLPSYYGDQSAPTTHRVPRSETWLSSGPRTVRPSPISCRTRCKVTGVLTRMAPISSASRRTTDAAVGARHRGPTC